ncbi:glycoside hydrolase family 65 protein [Allosalinactinospora lopnorensis]|uniref:glycoside hydrolase family 65 protein n=1 Tax=Allosalinactinospora lopnorensis TaxID=1352348 RepID=UPI000623FD4B|nr:glycosyl hydrolase family 65 protein [Allosalinactinospora lopnorensis]
MSRWLLSYGDSDLETVEEGRREALCTLGNGRFATRGAAPEVSADGVRYPGTYIAGCYNRLTSVIDGREIDNEDMVNVPDWLPFTFRIGEGPWFEGAAGEIREQHWELDMRRGVLTRLLKVRDPEGRETRLAQRRFVSMEAPALAALETTIVPLNWSGRVTVRSALDGRLTNCGVPRYRDLEGRHLRPLATGADEPDTAWLHTETVTSGIRISVAARTTGDRPHDDSFVQAADDAWIGHDLHCEVEEGEQTTFCKVVSLRTSRDHAIEEPLGAARRDVAGAGDFDTLLERHELAWSQLWRRCAIDVDDEDTQRVLNLHMFHIMQTLSPHTADLDVGVPARGLHGEAYRGHVFWDELFIFPFLNMNFPETARALLRYRWRRLPAAREAAAEAGYPGAMFPWQSGSDGREETQHIHLNPRSGHWIEDRSHRQRHVGIAIAYNAWHHYQYTDDQEFLAEYGAELILEIARFLAGIASYNKALDRYEIRGVMGPDEYHDGYVDRKEPGLDNNAYTNVMTAWVLQRALETLALLPDRRRRELEERLGLSRVEIDRFEDVSRRLRVPFHDGVISQFDGYESLAELDWESYREAYGDIRRLDRILEAEADTCNRYKASKQADVLMLFFLLQSDELTEILNHLGYDCDPEQLIPRTVDYYLERTSHGSTLSSVVHSWVLSRTDRASSWQFFVHALRSDIDDLQGGTTAEGIHIGAMAGTVDLLTRCYAGLETEAGTLRLRPRLPEEIERLTFTLRYHGHWDVLVNVVPGQVSVELPHGLGPPIRVEIEGETEVVLPGAACHLAW